MNKASSVLAICLAAALLLIFGAALLGYATPMADVSLDLTISMPEENTEIDPANSGSKGWTFYTQQSDERTELQPDGLGSYLGIELGQTFYYSRVLSEALNSPMLQIATANRAVSVWLDDALIYTDYPALDNRIGYLTLPMLARDREVPISISLPPDYQGKTLTIAQSFPNYSELSSVRATPCDVKLYCGYAYESRLISESFQLAIIAVAAFAVGTFLMIAFVRHRDVSLLCLGLVAFLWMVLQMRSASFFFQYSGSYGNTPDPALGLSAACALLVFLATRAGKYRKGLWGVIAVCTITVGAFLAYLYLTPISTPGSILYVILRLPYWTVFAAMLVTLAMGWIFWRKENSFYRLFTPAALLAIAIYWIAYCCAVGPSVVLMNLYNSLTSAHIDFVYHRILPPFMISALLTAIIETVREEMNLRTEKRLLIQRFEMTQAHYENMRLQHEEISMLRHDMTKHYRALHAMDSEEQRTAYLSELLGQNERIRPVFQSGNETIDIIIGSSLRTAADAGIKVNIVRSMAPKKLPVSDADLCSMVMNLMDNAVHAAAKSGVEKPCITLDLHIKNEFFVFTCRNSAARIERAEKKRTAPGHGLGLRIVNQIAERNNVLIETEYGSDYYEVTLAIAQVTP